MPPLSPDALWLLVAWTDPWVLGAAALGILLVIGIVVKTTRDGSASTTAANDARGAASTPPQPTPQAQAGPAQSPDPSPDREGSQATPEPPEIDPEDLAQGTGRTLAEMVAHEEIEDTELISRFVMDTDGSQVGETMSVTEGEVILKREDGFYAVPPDAIIEKSGTLLADGNLDWEKAREAGQRWEEENLDRMEYNDEGLPVKG